MSQRRSVLVFSSCCAALWCACSPARLPARALADSEATLRAAQQAGAEQVPAASLHVQLAKEHLARAQELIAQTEHERAEGALRRAKADAELALALAESAQSARAETAARARVSSLE